MDFNIQNRIKNQKFENRNGFYYICRSLKFKNYERLVRM